MSSSQRHRLQLIWLLAKTDFKLRYQGSVLGFLWALLKPLFIFMILNLVFSHLFAGDVPHFSLQLLMGILMWGFFSEGTMAGMTSLQSKSHILSKLAFSRWVIVVAASLQALMTFAINLLILLGALLLFEVPLSVFQLIIFLGYLLLLYLIVLGFSFIAAPTFIRFRDLNQIWEVLLTGGFYAAPIIYPLAVIPDWLQPWLFLNPMTFLIEHSKAILFTADISRLDHHVLYLSLVILGFVFSLAFFEKVQARVVEYL